MLNPLVIVFLKAPRAGRVKTRLAAEVGPERALEVYRRLGARQWREIPRDMPAEAHYTPHGAAREIKDWLGWRARVRAQSGSGLGGRLERALAGAFSRGYRPVIVIGGDCPALDGATLRSAAALLEKTDAVLGPARDGGFYLLGLREPQPGLLEEGIDWGTERVLAQTRARLAQMGLSCALLPEMEDIDDEDSLRRALGNGADWLGRFPELTAPIMSDLT